MENTEEKTTSQDQPNEKLVSVAEAIKYRKRAQAAEQQAEELNQQLKAVTGTNQNLLKQLDQAKTENRLTDLLIAASAHDLQAARVLAKEMMSTENCSDDEAVEKLVRQKQYLFNSQKHAAMPKSSGVKVTGNENTPIAQAARKAAASGSSSDVHRYMRIRRQFQ